MFEITLVNYAPYTHLLIVLADPSLPFNVSGDPELSKDKELRHQHYWS